MKRLILLLSLLCNVAIIAAQEPIWLTSQGREQEYPSNLYISGFALASIRRSDVQEDVVLRAKSDAIKLFAESIRVYVESSNRLSVDETDIDGDLKYRQVYSNYIKQSAAADIAGMSILTHYDAHDGVASAFVYADRGELISYYKAQLHLSLKSTEDALSSVDIALTNKNRERASERLSEALKYLAQAQFAQELLSALVPDDTEQLQISRFSEDKKIVFQYQMELDRHLNVYFDIESDRCDEQTILLVNQLKGLLSDDGRCDLVSAAESADYIFKVDVAMRMHDVQNSSFKFVYADVTVDLQNSDSVSVYSNQLSEKGGGMTADIAGRKALQAAADEIWHCVADVLK